ncbi:MAG: hypothetical protein JWO97_3302 [Acidobacteria bacterium]|nr:hypothetical protein [Acidobacteriota bacterium]
MLAFLLLFATTLAAQTATESWEGEFQTATWPTFITVRLTEGGGSIDVLGRSVPLTGVQRSGDSLRVVAGETTLLGNVSGDRWSGTLTSGTETFPFALNRIVPNASPKDRVNAWSQDLDALLHRFLKYDRSFSSGERARFTEEIEALRNDLPRLDDSQTIMRIASAIALARNGHTRLYLLRNRTELRRLPIRVWWFHDSLYVIRATPEYRKLLGCRIDDFAGIATRHARDVVSQAYAGNSSWKDYMTTYSLTSPEALHGFGITPDLDNVEIGVSGCGSAPFRATIKPLPLAKKTKATESWWDLSPQFVDPDRQWLQVKLRELPLYLRNPLRNYWFEFLPESGLLYFQYNRATDAADESTAAFGERLLAQFAAHKVKGLVIDLRFNTGGDLTIARELMRQLKAKSDAIPRFVLTGRNTFSAGISNVAMWKTPGAVIVGEPVGDDLDFYAEGGNIVLPNSGLTAHFANGAHSYSEAPCPNGEYCYDMSVSTLRPDLPASATWDEYLAGVDPMLRAAVAAVKASDPVSFRTHGPPRPNRRHR